MIEEFSSRVDHLVQCETAQIGNDVHEISLGERPIRKWDFGELNEEKIIRVKSGKGFLIMCTHAMK